MNFKFSNGDTVRDVITGHSGMVTAMYGYITGCSRYGVSSTKLEKDGTLGNSMTFDENQLELVKRGAYSEILSDPTKKPHFECGDELKDSITGMSGICTCVGYYSDGTIQYSLQPKKGKPQTWTSFDECRVRLVKRKALELEPTNENGPVKARTGGPKPEQARRGF